MASGFLDRVFGWFEPKRSWHRVFASAEEAIAALPDGLGVLYTISGKSTLLVRSGTHLNAIENRCPHEGKSLEQARMGPIGLVCPFHRHAIRLSDGLDVSQPGCGKTTVFPAKWEADGWYVER